MHRILGDNRKSQLTPCASSSGAVHGRKVPADETNPEKQAPVEHRYEGYVVSVDGQSITLVNSYPTTVTTVPTKWVVDRDQCVWAGRNELEQKLQQSAWDLLRPPKERTPPCDDL
jgi:hypothetical protein